MAQLDVRVRLATRHDAARLALIGAATFVETFAGILDGDAIVQHCASVHSVAGYDRYLADPAARAWLAEAAQGGGPVGYALLGTPDLPGADPDGGDLELKRIYVLSRCHGSGVGGRLMELAVQEARDRLARRLWLGVYAGNARAIAFYRKSGFEPVGTRRFLVGDRHYDDLVLARALD